MVVNKSWYGEPSLVVFHYHFMIWLIKHLSLKSLASLSGGECCELACDVKLWWKTRFFFTCLSQPDCFPSTVYTSTLVAGRRRPSRLSCGLCTFYPSMLLVHRFTFHLITMTAYCCALKFLNYELESWSREAFERYRIGSDSV